MLLGTDLTKLHLSTNVVPIEDETLLAFVSSPAHGEHRKQHTKKTIAYTRISDRVSRISHRMFYPTALFLSEKYTNISLNT